MACSENVSERESRCRLSLVNVPSQGRAAQRYAAPRRSRISREPCGMSLAVMRRWIEDAALERVHEALYYRLSTMCCVLIHRRDSEDRC